VPDFRFALIIPTLNAGANFELLAQSIKKQTVAPGQVIVLDSASDDHTAAVASSHGFTVLPIKREDFSHGGTRQLGVDYAARAEVVVFLTQDAILAHEEALANILHCFAEPAVGAAYGRQLPHQNARPIGAHARLFNYPPQSRIKKRADAAALGLKTAFISNSFAAYRQTALAAAGGFPAHVIASEDTYVAAKMLLAGWHIYYCAEALVYHSHDYSIGQEFRRYFAIGSFHGSEPWIRAAFGQAEGEGLQYVLSEFKYLWRQGGKLLIPRACLQNMGKLLGYRLGCREKNLPLWLKNKMKE